MSLKSVVEKVPFYNQLVLPWHFVQAAYSSLRYGRPAKRLRVIAVTGTNGKTTTCFMIWKMLNAAGYKTGLLTTVGWSEDGEELHKQFEHMTTERVGVLNRRMRMVADAGAEFLVLEVTSHALAQYRILGVPIEVAVFTNLTHDHLDYHKTMERYRAAKLKLFKQAKNGVVNADDVNGKYFAQEIAKHKVGEVICYGVQAGDLRAKDVQLKPEGVEYVCQDLRKDADERRELEIKTQIPGEFNVYNSLAAVGVGELVGLTDAEIQAGILALSAVEGRMTRVQAGQDFTVIVDYAHAPDALEKVFKSVKTEGRIIAVHGGAGRRDHSTRAERGEILAKNSDIVIITEDDSRDEDPKEIAEMFVEGSERAGKVRDKDLFVIIDRREAIQKAIDLAKPGDVVLILGKGHEKTILRNDGAHDFEDIKVAREILAGLKR